MDGFAEMFRGQGLPEAGSVVRCRRTNSLWRVMEREVWHWVEEPPVSRVGSTPHESPPKG